MAFATFTLVSFLFSFVHNSEGTMSHPLQTPNQEIFFPSTREGACSLWFRVSSPSRRTEAIVRLVVECCPAFQRIEKSNPARSRNACSRFLSIQTLILLLATSCLHQILPTLHRDAPLVLLPCEGGARLLRDFLKCLFLLVFFLLDSLRSW